MHVSHIALWTDDLEKAKDFWKKYFNAIPNEVYHSKRRPSFKSYFIMLDSGAQIELMTIDKIERSPHKEFLSGWNHIAISLGSTEAVDKLAEELAKVGLLVSSPRYTGDNYYEAVIKDYDGNLIEIMK